jgi:predicted RND superfamily exporter protein
MKKVDQIATRLSQSIVNRPLVYLAMSLVVLAVSIIGTMKIESTFSVKVWLNPDDQRILNLQEHEKTFGSSETMDVVIYNKKGVFTEKTLKAIQSLTEDMWQIEDIVRVESITNFNWIESIEDEIEILPFIDEDFDFSKEALNQKGKIASTDKQTRNNYVSSSGRLAIIRSFLRTYEDHPRYELVVTQVEKLIEQKYQSDEYEVHLGGLATINEALKRASDRDMLLVFPIVILVLISILYFFFRNITGIVFPFMIIITTIAFTFGAEGFLGIKFNNIISAVPAILMSIGLADAIHILVAYRHNVMFEHQEPHLAAQNSLIKNFIPTILTTVTTATGFLSLTSAEIAPIHDLGLLSGIGSFAAWFFTYFLLGPLLPFTKFKKREVHENLSHMGGVYDFCFNHKYLINFSFPIIAIAMVYLGSMNKINADPVEYFSDSTAIKQTFDKIESEYGGSRAIELVFDSGEKDGVKDPAFLQKSAEFIEWLEARPEIIRVNSIVQIIKKMNKTLNGDNNKFYKIPETRRGIADQLFLYTLGLPEGMDLKNQLSLDNRKFRSIVQWNINDTMNAIVVTEEILAKAKEMGLNIYEGGQSPIYNRVNDLVVDTFFSSMGYSIPIIFMIILFVFKDFLLALLSLIPNLFPLGVASGLMYLNGDEINIGNVIVFAVCLGIAVDDTIHFIANYKIKRNKGMDTEKALRGTIAQTGKALILTTIMLILGFGLFILGDFVPNQKFGLYCAIILFLAIFADLILLPSVILAVAKKDK